ncbi:glycosyl hydrolase family 92-domain-containing protein [Sphaerosporella brunnea]|uniref:Glycosyl hydrolase family 92-domain-containing protein n=1 Tax=Sphaerosporella brunnea TaxID=1250544 RepID=A0A5J5F040_9PEZI|nr:glycosyl hydrolase family 92-domain-containing protein [Sphaerosporella brunnea]
MGTQGGGNMFPGVTLPFGVVKLGIDLNPPRGAGDPYSGYHAEGNVTGFSMMHESGTGGAPKYGVVSQLPVVGDISNPLLDYSLPRAEADEAQLGYYKAMLSNHVTVELAANRHAGVVRHTFPADDKEKNVLVDVSHFLPSTRRLGIEQHYVEGGIKLNNDATYSGYGVYNGGWNDGPDWKIFFCGGFSQPHRAAAFEGTGTTLESFGKKSEVSGKKRVGAVFTFDQKTGSELLHKRDDWALYPRQQQSKTSKLVVEGKLGISWISEEQACNFLQEEVPADSAFDSLVQIAQKVWNRDVFSKVTVEDASTAQLQLLYSSIYGMFLIPSDRTGENPGWNSTEPYYDDIFTLWDLFRCGTPLFHILQPERYVDFLRSLVDIWRHDGWLPDGRSSNFNGRTQGGSNADNVLADARVKGVTGVNWEDAYSAMVTDAEKQPPNNNDPQAADSSTKEGRGALPDWLSKGYITTKYTRSVSRAVEYAVNDFALSQVAKSLGKTADYQKYANRSQNWKNHWDARMNVYGFTGFLSPVDADGSFPATPHDPLDCGSCYWDAPYYQALPFEYSFNAYHDMKTMIELMGGDRKFISRLEKLFERNANPHGSSQFGNTLFNPGNEPSFASPYLFNFVPRNQWRSVEKSRYIARSYYNPGAKGLPGNSDAGAMQSWLLWSMIGLYPITGTTTFLVGSPQFKHLAIDLGDGKKFEVKSSGGNEESGAWFVQSLKVNGKQWNKSWVTWDDVFANGGTLEFELGTDKKEWDTGDRPLWGIIG